MSQESAPFRMNPADIAGHEQEFFNQARDMIGMAAGAVYRQDPEAFTRGYAEGNNHVLDATERPDELTVVPGDPESMGFFFGRLTGQHLQDDAQRRAREDQS